MKIERKSYPVTELKIADDQQGVIEAIVSVFSNTDSGNEKVMPGFFTKSIERKLPKGVWAHDWKQPIAKTLEAKELLPGDPQLPDSLKLLGGAYIKGQFNLDTQRGREAYSDIKFGIVDEFSIGYRVVKDGKDKESGARELIEGEWKEWSPVLVGMNDQTALISIKEAPANKGMLAEELAQTTPSTWEIESAFRRIIRKIAETAKNAPTIGESTFDWRAKVAEVLGEYGPTMQPLIVAQIEE
jgi:HK97 family phage prohead protease